MLHYGSVRGITSDMELIQSPSGCQTTMQTFCGLHQQQPQDRNQLIFRGGAKWL